MASYKVIQDIEAEDKLLGPLTLRQFIYGGVAAVCLWLSYFFVSHHVGFLAIPLVPVAAVGAFLAFPWGRDQPTEIWALAKVRFLIKPRRRIWNQDGIKELVTVTAPKHTATSYTNGLSQMEVRSRLHALADTIDSRGWAIKNSNLNLYGQSPAAVTDSSSDRLIGPTSLPQPVENVDIQAADDMLDENSNAGAQRLQSMISESSKAHRDKLIETMNNPAQAQTPARPNNYWFLNQPAAPANIPNNMVTFNTQVVTPGLPTTNDDTPEPPMPDEAKLVAELDARKQEYGGPSFYGHLHQIKPLSEQAQATPPPPQLNQPIVSQVPADQPQAQSAPLNPLPTPVPPPVTPASQAAILKLASNDDLNVATIAREAERANPQNEVVIKLH